MISPFIRAEKSIIMKSLDYPVHCMVLAKYRGKILTNNKQLICSYLPLQHDLMKALVLTMNRSRMSR